MIKSNDRNFSSAVIFTRQQLKNVLGGSLPSLLYKCCKKDKICGSCKTIPAGDTASCPTDQDIVSC